MSELAKLSDLKPASFENPSNRLTDAQKMLLKLLKESSENKKPITKDIIIDFYIKYVKKSETYMRGDCLGYDSIRHRLVYGDPKEKMWRESYGIFASASQWFRLNLGSVILKGKILILPVIDIE